MTDFGARYAAAARALPIPLMSRMLNVAVEGYWLDERRYFFVEERYDETIAKRVTVPRLADAATGEIVTVIEPDVLAALLADWGGGTSDGVPVQMQFDLPSTNRLAVSDGRRWWLIDLSHFAVIAEEACGGSEQFSPDGHYAVSVRGHNLWLRDRHDGEIRPLTIDGILLYPWGQEPENGLAPLTYRRRPWPVARWSADSAWLLTHRIDERELPETVLVQHAPPGGGAPVAQIVKYSTVGDALPICSIVAIHIATGRIVSGAPCPLQIFSPAAIDAAWFAGPDVVHYLRLDRFRRHAELVELNLETGAERVLVEERAARGYIDTHPLLARQPNIRSLPDSNEIIWWSERDGNGHLYLLDSRDGSVKNRITRGAWQVRDIVHVDCAGRRVLFTAGGVDPRRDPGLRTLCVARFDGTAFETLIEDAGDVAVAAAPPQAPPPDRPFRPYPALAGASLDGRYVVARLTGLQCGSRTVIRDIVAAQSRPIATARSTDGSVMRAPIMIEAVAADDRTALWGALFVPSDFSPDRRYPLIDFIYPGPQFAWLPRAFATRTAAQAQAWAELGAVVLMMDSRGMPFRSRALHQAGYGDLFEPQLADHAAVIEQLCQRHRFIDRDRIGIAGYSGGGAATVRALIDYPALFRSGVALCGNHDSRQYRSLWMDYYVGPASAEQAERQANPPRAAQLVGDLFLLHGDADENVPLAQTLALGEALIAGDRTFDMLIVPNEGHDLLFTSAYVQRRIWDFWLRTLFDAAPPSFHLRYDDRARIDYARAVANERAA